MTDVSTAIERVSEYLERKRESTQIDPTSVHGFGRGDGTTTTLYTADLESLVEAARRTLTEPKTDLLREQDAIRRERWAEGR